VKGDVTPMLRPTAPDIPDTTWWTPVGNGKHRPAMHGGGGSKILYGSANSLGGDNEPIILLHG